MPSKGIVRTGEAYCLSCYQEIDRNLNKCPGCLSELTGEVKAFRCPKCQQIVALGEPKCSKCGLKFKVKTLKTKEAPQDDQFLAKLIEWGKPDDEAPIVARAAPVQPPSMSSSQIPETTADQLTKLTRLKESIDELMMNRSEMLDRMEKRMESERASLERISKMADQEPASKQVEAEIMALADEMADITMLQAHMEMLSDELSSLMESVEVTGEVRDRGLAARALRLRLDQKEKELSELKSREEQLTKKEEMIDNKIQAYAAKKKLLDQSEEELKKKLAVLEEERAQLDILKTHAQGARTNGERDEMEKAWKDEQNKVRQMLLGVKSRIAEHIKGKSLTDAEMASAEDDLETVIAELESQIADLIIEKAEIQKKMSEATVVDEDLRRLLKVLDQMLAQLPEEIIDKFSKSEEFTLYERVLDKLKI